MDKPCVGDVYDAFVDRAGKRKMIIVIGTPPGGVDLVYVLINSALTNAQQLDPKIRRLKLPWAKQGHPYLRHDSFIDCEEPMWENMSVFESCNPPPRKKGALTEGELYLIRKTICLESEPGRWSYYDLKDMGINVGDFAGK